jgi:hypothetical protein
MALNKLYFFQPGENDSLFLPMKTDNVNIYSSQFLRVTIYFVFGQNQDGQGI